MATKTLTIMEDAYKLLLDNKLESESFSEEIRRIMARKPKKSLMDYFGIISNEEGEKILNALKESEEIELKLQSKRMKMLYGKTKWKSLTQPS